MRVSLSLLNSKVVFSKTKYMLSLSGTLPYAVLCICILVFTWNSLPLVSITTTPPTSAKVQDLCHQKVESERCWSGWSIVTSSNNTVQMGAFRQGVVEERGTQYSHATSWESSVPASHWLMAFWWAERLSCVPKVQFSIGVPSRTLVVILLCHLCQGVWRDLLQLPCSASTSTRPCLRWAGWRLRCWDMPWKALTFMLKILLIPRF